MKTVHLPRIQIWPVDYTTERDDLALSLDDCGTGLGQVIAMLYVIVMSDSPRIIVIDEPNSFLHPGAARSLMAILKSASPKHQYIFTTHSSALVSSLDTSVINQITNIEGESRCDMHLTSKHWKMKLVLDDLGVRLSDVFGADSVLWVEGATEEQCYPLILLKLSSMDITHVAILGVRHTSDFESVQVSNVVGIYRKLSSGTALIPPAVGFLFDRETRTEEENAEHNARKLGAVRFLDRRMYENSLINPDAISAVIAADLR